MQYGRSISVKCSSRTLQYIDNLFAYDNRFVKIGKGASVPNPSWFFKFVANYTLKNFTVDEKIEELAYKSHFVDFLDNNLKRYTIE